MYFMFITAEDVNMCTITKYRLFVTYVNLPCFAICLIKEQHYTPCH